MHKKILQDYVLTAVLEEMFARLAFHTLTQGWRLETNAKLLRLMTQGSKSQMQLARPVCQSSFVGLGTQKEQGFHL